MLYEFKLIKLIPKRKKVLYWLVFFYVDFLLIYAKKGNLEYR